MIKKGISSNRVAIIVADSVDVFIRRRPTTSSIAFINSNSLNCIRSTIEYRHATKTTDISRRALSIIRFCYSSNEKWRKC
jgi:hypothetical protein